MDDNKDNKKQRDAEATKNAGIKAAKAYGGPLGAGVSLASKTKLGDALLTKSAEKFNKADPNKARLIRAADKLGALDAAGLGNGNKAGAGGKEGLPKEGGLPKDGLEDGNLKGKGNKKSKSPLGNLGSDDNQNEDASGDSFVDVEMNFIKKHWMKIAAVFGGFMMLMFLALIIVVVISSVGEGVVNFFQKVGDTVIGFFQRDEFDAQKAIDDYYDELDNVKRKIYQRKNVCIDENLITATLTVDMDAYRKSEQFEEEPDIDDENEYSSTVDEYKKMKQQVALLANMEMKILKYGKSTRDCMEGDPCNPLGYETKIELVTEENYECFDTNPFDWLGIILNSGFDKKDALVSSNPFLVSLHDKDGFFKFFTKKTNWEKNYEYYIYTPAYEEVDDYDDRGFYRGKKLECDSTPPKESYQLSIGDLNTMEGSVYYWNLVNSFIPEYYAEYIPDGGEERDKAIANIAHDIYLLYKDLGPGTTCDGKYEFNYNDNYNFSCLDGNGDDLNNVLVQLTDNNGNPLPNEGLIGLENYVMGVVYAEDHATNNEEAMKAQAVAARTYLMHAGKKSLESDGSTIIKIKNSTYNQVYCDPVTGCWWDGKNGHVVYNTSQPGTNVYKGPLSGDYMDQLQRVIQETMGEIMYTADGDIYKNGYTSTKQNRWNDMQGSTYLEMLADTEGDAFASVESECIGSPYSGGGYFAGAGTWADWRQGQNNPWSNLIVGYYSNGNPIYFKDIGCYVTSMFNLIAYSGIPTIYGSGNGIDYEAIVRDLISSAQFGSGGSFLNNWDYINSHLLQGGSIQQHRDNDANNGNIISKTNQYQSQGKYVQVHIQRFKGYDAAGNPKYDTHFVAAERAEGGDVVIHDSGMGYTRLSQYQANGWFVTDVRAYTIG